MTSLTPDGVKWGSADILPLRALLCRPFVSEVQFWFEEGKYVRLYSFHRLDKHSEDLDVFVGTIRILEEFCFHQSLSASLSTICLVNRTTEPGTTALPGLQWRSCRDGTLYRQVKVPLLCNRSRRKALGFPVILVFDVLVSVAYVGRYGFGRGRDQIPALNLTGGLFHLSMARVVLPPQ